MKKVFFVLSLGCLLSIGQLAAQTCNHSAKATSGKSCTKAEMKACGSATVSAAALTAAVNDPTIEKKVCEKSGAVCFVRKSVDATTGEASFASVKYDDATATFVNYTPETTEVKGKKACCKAGSKSCTKATGASSAKGAKTSAAGTEQ
ncbi:MAG: hypothetical protein M3Q56_02310 [Bacteroidota bacterium]|nr:hypothetical protein [Bacteroidota bacterium]